MAAKENRKYKNSVFVDLFFEDESAEENEISLYNALHEDPPSVGIKGPEDQSGRCTLYELLQ